MLYQHPSVKPKQVVRFGLLITCRIAAEEMRDIALQKIHFTTRSEFPEKPRYLGLQSRAGRFRYRKQKSINICVLFEIRYFFATVLRYVWQ